MNASKEDRDIINALRDLGLEGEKAEVILSLVKRGEQSIGELSSTTTISRTKLYYIIDDLMAEGWVELTGERPKRFKVRDLEGQIKQRKSIVLRAANLVKKTLLPIYRANGRQRSMESLSDMDLVRRVEEMLGRCRDYALIVPNFIPPRIKSRVMQRVEALKDMGVNVEVLEKNAEKKLSAVLRRFRTMFKEDDPRYYASGFIIVDGTEILIASRADYGIVNRNVNGIWTKDPGIVAMGEALFAAIT